jgi:hypothetical protein
VRTVADDESVRLYHLDPDNGVATTLLYGTLAAALREAAVQSEEVQDGLYIQTSNDVVAYRDLTNGESY